MKIFLITGNTGFIGQNILNSNIFSNHKLILINRKKTYHKKQYLNYNFKDFKKVKNYNIELFIHLAAADPENSNHKNIIEINKKIDNVLIYLKKKIKLKKFFLHLQIAFLRIILFKSLNKILYQILKKLTVSVNLKQKN